VGLVSDASELSDSESRLIATVIREHLARRRISRQRLADDAKISISTLEKALGGSRPFTLATIVRLEAALGLSLRRKPADAQEQPDGRSAPAALGSYSHAAVKWLEGNYLTLRPSFEIKGVIYAYRIEILWDSAEACLVFRESERLDAPFAQRGVVSVPNKSGHIYLHTNEDGQLRLAVLGRPLITGEMYGVLTTLAAASGTQLVPAAAPLALVPLGNSTSSHFGRIPQASPAYAGYRAHLEKASAPEFVRIVSI
jgi:transcriptional regulator with XRE-family HTH domain